PPEGAGGPAARPPPTTATRLRRTFTSPATCAGAPGIRVGSNRGRISRTVAASAEQARLPTRNTRSRTASPSLIRCEEAKILQGVAFSKQVGVLRRCRQRRRQIGGPFGVQHEANTGHRMLEPQLRRVQQLSW